MEAKERFPRAPSEKAVLNVVSCHFLVQDYRLLVRHPRGMMCQHSVRKGSQPPSKKINAESKLNDYFTAFLEGGLGETILWLPKNGFPQKIPSL